ncbi:MAG TPA: Ig-like domain-containing protein [Bryobacteraceae bacterium]
MSSSTVTRAAEPDTAPSGGTISSVTPSSNAAGEIFTLVISGSGTSFVQGQTKMSLGAGISIGGAAPGTAGLVTVTSSTSATAQVTIAPSATLGPQTVTVTTGSLTATLNAGFTVVAAPAALGPLRATSTLPANAATGIAVNTAIKVAFNEQLDPSTVGPNTFVLTNSSSGLRTTTSIDSTGEVVTLTPAGVLTPSTTYTVTIAAQVRNTAESPLGTPFVFSFTTAAPTVVSGTLTFPTGLDPTTLSVVSFGGSVTTPNASGVFSASLGPLGTSVVAAMLPGKTFGFLAVALPAAGAGSSATKAVAAPAATGGARRVYKTQLQITSSAAAASDPGNLVMDFQTTAEALVFMTPYLVTADPAKAPSILNAIASNAATATLATALSAAWSEANPLTDPAVQSAGQAAVTVMLQSLAAATITASHSAQLRESNRTAGANDGSPSASDSSGGIVPTAAPATVAVTPYCWTQTNHIISTSGLQCLDLDYISFPSVGVNPSTGNYAFNTLDCSGCTTGWLARITPIPSSTNPDSILALTDAYGAESPVGSPYDSTNCTAAAPCVAAWVEGGSALQYVDLEQVFLASLASALQTEGLNLASAGPVFSLAAPTQETAYLVRLYSGGIADATEESRVAAEQYSDAKSQQLNSQARGLNLLRPFADGIDTFGIFPAAAVNCAVGAAVKDVVSGKIVLNGANTLAGNQTDLNNVAADTLYQLNSCLPSALLGDVVEMMGGFQYWGAGLGTGINVSGVVSNLSELLQRNTELVFSASAVESAIVTLAPGSAASANPLPAITSLSLTSAAAGASPMAITITGTFLLSNSTVTFNGVAHSATQTPAGGLSITLTAADLATPGTFNIVVTNPAPGGGASNAASFSVTAALTLSGLTLSSGSTVGGTPLTGTVTLSSAAPASGVVVALKSNNSSVSTPASLTIASGHASASFPITTSTVSAVQTVTVTATLGGSTKTAVLTVSPSAAKGLTLQSLTLSVGAVTGGNPVTATVTLSGGAPAGGVAVNLASNNSLVTVPGSVTIGSGLNSASFAVTTGAVSIIESATITATLGASTETALLTISPAGAVSGLQNLTLSGTSITGGTGVTGTVILSSPASAGGTLVTLLSSNPSVQVPPTLTIASGMNSGVFAITTSVVAATQTATLTASLGGSSVTAVLTVFPGGSGTLNPSDTITITDVSGITQTNYPEQVGRPFVDGEISNYPVAIVNGFPLFTQADVKNRYPDGSVKFAILSFLLPTLPANGSVTVAFGNQSTGNNTPLTQAQMLDPSFNFDAQMLLTSGSAAQSASARTMLTNGNFSYWTSGPVATTVILADHSATAAYDMGFDAYKPIRPIFEATFWPTLNQVKVRYILEDSNTLALEDVSYNATLTIGSTAPLTVYNSTAKWPSGIPQVGATRWTKVFWIGGAPTDLQNINYNLAYLESTNAVPNFDTTKPITAFAIANDYTTWTGGATDIYQAFEGSNAYTWDAFMPDTGGRLDIAPFPAWYTRWLYTGDYREREIMLGNADRAAAWPVNMREGATGLSFDLTGAVPAIGHVFSIAARPTVDFSQAFTQPSANGTDRIRPVGPITSFEAGNWQWDSAHLPDAFFLPYLATGDFFYLEQMNFWTAFSAAYPVASTSENYGRGASLKSGVVYMGQVRSEAWGLRERAEIAWIEPDGTPEKTLFNQWMASYIGVLDGLYDQTTSVYFGNADWNWGHTVRITNPSETYDGINHPPIPGHTGVEWNYGSSSLCGGNYGTNATVSSCQSGFMLSYLAYALGRAYQLGFPTNNLLGNVVGPWYVAVVTDPTYNPYMLLADRIPTQKAAGPAYYSTMPDILNGYWQTLAQATAAGANVWAGLSSFPLSDPVNGYDFLGSAAIAAIANFTPGGTTAWNWVHTKIESASNYGSVPDWALLPVEP